MWQVEINETEDVVLNQHQSLAERETAAQTCSLRLDLSIPTLLDEMSNEVDYAYAALPERLYLIDPEGRVAFRGDAGPMGFLPDLLDAAIQELLGESQN
jgi:hypothetical protein